MADRGDLLDLLLPVLELGGSPAACPEYMQELVSEIRSDPVGQWFLERCREKRVPGTWDNLALLETARSYPEMTEEKAVPVAGRELPQVDLKQAVVYTSQGQAWLTPAETRLLACLARQPGVIVSHRTLSEIISQDYTGAVWVEPKYHIRNLRIKLGDDLQNPRIIRTRRGMGYYLDEKMKGRIVG